MEARTMPMREHDRDRADARGRIRRAEAMLARPRATRQGVMLPAGWAVFELPVADGRPRPAHPMVDRHGAVYWSSDGHLYRTSAAKSPSLRIERLRRHIGGAARFAATADLVVLGDADVPVLVPRWRMAESFIRLDDDDEERDRP